MNTYTETQTEVVFREVNINYSRKRKTPVVRSADDVVRWLRAVAPNNSQEHLIALYLDGAHQPIGFSVVSTGIQSACPVHPREVFQRAIALGAYSLILAHNHPSGKTDPSAEDVKVTEQIRDAGKLLGIRLVDHIIISDEGHYSFQAESNVQF